MIDDKDFFGKTNELTRDDVRALAVVTVSAIVAIAVITCAALLSGCTREDMVYAKCLLQDDTKRPCQ